MNFYLYLWRPNCTPDHPFDEVSRAAHCDEERPGFERTDFQFLIDEMREFGVEQLADTRNYSVSLGVGVCTLRLGTQLCLWGSLGARPDDINRFIAIGQKHDCFVCDPQRSEALGDDRVYRARHLEKFTPTDEFRELVRAEIVPHLRASGFKGSFPRFYRGENPALALHFQGYSSGGAMRVNYQVFDLSSAANASERKRIIQGRPLRSGCAGPKPGGDYWYRYDYAPPERIIKAMKLGVDELMDRILAPHDE